MAINKAIFIKIVQDNTRDDKKMIISTLREAVFAKNRTRMKRGLKPIKSPYQLSKLMKKANLKVSRPTLNRLWNDSPYSQKKRKKYQQNKNRKKEHRIVGSISFDTLNSLVKFLNEPVSHFIRYIGFWTDIKYQSYYNFVQNHNINSYQINKYIPNGSTVLLITDKHTHKHINTRDESVSGKQKYILIFTPQLISAGASNNIVGGYSIHGSFERCLEPKNTSVNPEIALHDILKNLNDKERAFLDENIIINFKKYDRAKLYRNLKLVNVLDGLGYIKIKSYNFSAPKLSYSLSNKNNITSYNFRFFNSIN